MANMREIRTRMKSIRETMQITNAMYLISSSKLKKARKQLLSVEPYFEKIQSTIADILSRSEITSHAYFDQREDAAEKKKAYVVITADKGLAGSYNQNVIRLAEGHMKEEEKNYLFTIGQVGRNYFIRKNYMIDIEFLYTVQNPTFARAKEIGETLINLYLNKKVDEIYLVYTNMVTTVRLEPEVIKLLPLERHKLQGSSNKDKEYTQFTTYTPSENAVLDRLVPNYVKGVIFGALVESYSSEQSARMTAMDAATTNAKDMIKELTLMYNRARQASITQEISEIVGGADALK